MPMQTTNRTLVDPTAGAIRFWYRPLFDAGTGPGHIARLVTLVSAAGHVSAAGFSLALSADGRTLALACGEEPTPCLQTPVALEPGGWVLLTLGYGPTNSALFLNDTLVATGSGLPTIPAQAVPATALVIGSGPNGQEPAAGQIEELTVFGGRSRFRQLMGCPFGLSPDYDIAAYWRNRAATAARGPISEAEDAARQALLAALQTERLAARGGADRLGASLDGGGVYGPQGASPSPCGTNSIYEVWITNTACAYDQTNGWMVSFGIGGGTNGVLYDVFAATNLVGNNITNSQWWWVTNGYACDIITLTNVLVTIPPLETSVVLTLSAESDINGDVLLYPHGSNNSQGLAVDNRGHVWVAHQKNVSYTVGHLNTNGMLVGVVNLQVEGLWAEYFANTNLAGWPALTNLEGPVDFTSATGWPGTPALTNAFSARWTGIVAPQAQGDHVFYVSAEPGAAFRLKVNGAIIIDNWMVIHDSGMPHEFWKSVSWNAALTNGSSVEMLRIHHTL